MSTSSQNQPAQMQATNPLIPEDLSPQQRADMVAALAHTKPATGEHVRQALSDALSIRGHNYQPLVYERLRRAEVRVPAIVRRLLDVEAEIERLTAERDAKPSRFTGTPAEIDAWMRVHFTEDTYLRFQQAIGAEAVREAMDDATAYRNADDNVSKKQAWRSGIDDALGYIDPEGDGGPYPSKLLCSKHNGWAPCPGAPWCTPRQGESEDGAR